MSNESDKAKLIQETLQQKLSQVLQMQDEDKKRVEESNRVMAVHFEQVANRILEEKQQRLQASNLDTLKQQVLNPLNERFQEFKESVDKNTLNGRETAAELRAKIELITQNASEISRQANHLADALVNGNKVQGTWGEQSLEGYLISIGLKEGVHYETQQKLKDQFGKAIRHSVTGKEMIPDFIIHYADGMDVVIDSKVNIKHYLDYVSAETPEAKKIAARQHVEAVRKQVKDLSNDDYSHYVDAAAGRSVVDFTIMYMPNEGSYQLAMMEDSDLWNIAREARVFIVDQMNLMVFLQMIKMGWTRFEQEKNIDEIIDMAGKVIESVNLFQKDQQAVGRAIETLSKAHEDSKRHLTEGNSSVYARSSKLEELGARRQKKLMQRKSIGRKPE